MQLRLQPRSSRGPLNRSLIIKTILFIIVFFLAIFLLDKIEFRPASEIIEKEISNDKLITIK